MRAPKKACGGLSMTCPARMLAVMSKPACAAFTEMEWMEL
jgi:hypothetical protein